MLLDLQESLTSLQSTVDIGAEVRCRALVPDTSRLFVSVGLGFHVECTLDEVPKVSRVSYRRLPWLPAN